MPLSEHIFSLEKYGILEYSILSFKMTVQRNALMAYHAELILYICASLSIIGSIIIVATYVMYKEIRSPARHIIACIGISDLILSVANLLGGKFDNAGTSEFCIIQSFIGSTFVSCSFMWTMMLSVFLYLCLVKGKLKYATSLIHPWFHLMCWLFPLGVNVVALSLGKLGNNGDVAASGWCWIRVPKGGKFSNNSLNWMILDGKGLEIITYIVITVLYLRIKLHLHRQGTNLEKEQGLSSQNIIVPKTVDRKFLLIPVLYILLRIWGTIRFFLYATNMEASMHWKQFNDVVSIMQVFGDNLVGAANCVLFCFLTPKVLSLVNTSLKDLGGELNHCRCLRYCCCFRKEEPLMDTTILVP